MPSSNTPIYTAFVANLAIAATKITAAVITGSSAMLSEGVHSLVDCSNEVLLYVGIRRSQKSPNSERPFGYGKELYFWSFVVALLFFVLGGIVSIYEGVKHVLHPEPIENFLWSYIALGVAFVFDGVSFITALREFNRQRGATPFWQAVRQSKDPGTFVVLFEDAADVIGVVIAFAGIVLSRLLHNPYIDGVSSILIGLLLTGVAFILLQQCRSLLMGESAPAEELQAIVQWLRQQPEITDVQAPMSMYLGPEEVILLLKIKFGAGVSGGRVADFIRQLRGDIQAQHPHYRHLFIEPV